MTLILLLLLLSTVDGYCESTLSVTLPPATNMPYMNRPVGLCSDKAQGGEQVILQTRVRGDFIVDVLCVDGGTYLPLRHIGTVANFAKAGNVETCGKFFFFFFFFFDNRQVELNFSPNFPFHSYYCALRFDPDTLLVDVGDVRFATTLRSTFKCASLHKRRLKHSIHHRTMRRPFANFSVAPFGFAAACNGDELQSNIDLRDTPFAIAYSMGWKSVGSLAHTLVSISDVSQQTTTLSVRGGSGAGECAWLSPSRSIAVSSNANALALCSMLSWHLVLRVANGGGTLPPDCPPYGGKLSEEGASLCGVTPRDTLYAPPGTCEVVTSTFAGQTRRTTTTTLPTTTSTTKTTTTITTKPLPTTVVTTTSRATTTTTETETNSTTTMMAMSSSSVPLTEQTSFLIAVIVGPVLLIACVVAFVTIVAVRAKRRGQRRKGKTVEMQRERVSVGEYMSSSGISESTNESVQVYGSPPVVSDADAVYSAPPMTMMPSEAITYAAPPQATMQQQRDE
jgi:hypothetical protein